MRPMNAHLVLASRVLVVRLSPIGLRYQFLRQSLVEWAGQTIPKSFWAGPCYRQQRAKGPSRHVPIRGLAFKWIRGVFRCWQDRKSYNESLYLNALKRSGSPLFASIAKDSQPA
jgi:hypothetical protein